MRAAGVLIAAALAVLLFGPKAIESDGRGRADNLRTVLDRGSLAAPVYSHVGPLLSTPLLLLDRAAGANERVLAQYNWLLLAVGVVGLNHLLRPILTADVRGRFLLLLVLGSMFPANAQNYFGETFTATTVAVGLTAAVRGRAWGWPLAVLGVVNTPATAVGFALALGVYCRHERRLRPLLLLPLTAALILGENYVARGSPFATGYGGNAGVPTVLPFSGRPGFSYPFFFGVLSLVLSFGKGLVFFAPGLFLPCPPLEGRARLLLRMWIAVAVGLVIVYAKWWAWYGGLAWGPRMLLFASLPASLMLATASAEPSRDGRRKLLVLAALALSCWVGVSGFAFGSGLMRPFVGENYQTEFVLWYVPECSVLWLPFVVPSEPRVTGHLFLMLGGVAFAFLAARTVRNSA